MKVLYICTYGRLCGLKKLLRLSTATTFFEGVFVVIVWAIWFQCVRTCSIFFTADIPYTTVYCITVYNQLFSFCPLPKNKIGLGSQMTHVDRKQLAAGGHGKLNQRSYVKEPNI